MKNYNILTGAIVVIGIAGGLVIGHELIKRHSRSYNDIQILSEYSTATCKVNEVGEDDNKINMYFCTEGGWKRYAEDEWEQVK